MMSTTYSGNSDMRFPSDFFQNIFGQLSNMNNPDQSNTNHPETSNMANPDVSFPSDFFQNIFGQLSNMNNPDQSNINYPETSNMNNPGNVFSKFWWTVVYIPLRSILLMSWTFISKS